MTMIDDDQLASLLTRAAEDFEVPATGPDEIVLAGPDRVGAGTDRTGGSVRPTRSKTTRPMRQRTEASATRVRRPGRGRVACAGPARRRRTTACSRWRPASSLVLAAVAIGAALGRSTPATTATSSLRPVRSAAPPRAGSPHHDVPAPDVQHGPRADSPLPRTSPRGPPSRRRGSRA